MNLDETLIEMIEREGSDLHIKAGRPPLIRISGELLPTEHDATSSDEILEALDRIASSCHATAILDVTKMRDVTARISDRDRDISMMECSRVLLQGLAVGLFLTRSG